MVYEGYWSVRTSTQLKKAGQKTSKGSIVKRDYTLIPDGHTSTPEIPKFTWPRTGFIVHSNDDNTVLIS